MDPNTFAFGFTVGIVCALLLFAISSLAFDRPRPRGAGYQSRDNSTPGRPPAGRAGASSFRR